MPVTLFLITLLIGVSLLWLSRWKRAGKIVVSVGTALLIAFSYGLLSDIILGSLENEYKPVINSDLLTDVKWVVVLSGGHVSDPGLPVTDRMTAASLARLVEGIRIHNILPESKLILSGGAVFDSIPEAITMASAALSLGVNKENLILESLSKDTKDQAIHIRKILDNNPFILVTSASHMPRSIALFRKQGLQPIPAPTDFWVKEHQKINPGSFFPSAMGLRKMERAVHEYLGLAWAKLRRQI